MIDSGGQYYEGTTDITRSVHFGTPTPKQKVTELVHVCAAEGRIKFF